MTPRKRKAIGFIITGLVTAGVGAVLLVTTNTPEWVVVGIQVVAAVSNVLGFIFIAPDPTV